LRCAIWWGGEGTERNVAARQQAFVTRGAAKKPYRAARHATRHPPEMFTPFRREA
jgi:hypothetical protein